MSLVENTASGLHKEIYNLIPKCKYNKYLDVGCGSGALLKRLDDFYVRGVGIDISSDSFKLKSDKVSFFVKDLNNLGFVSGDYDLITCVEVIEHLENPFLLMKNLSCCLSNNGLLVVSSPNIYNFVSKFLFVFNNSFVNFMDKNVEEHITPLIENVFERKIVKDCGLEIVGKFYSSFHIPFTNVNVPLKSKFFGNNVIYLIKKTGD